MGNKRKYESLESLLARPWCFYCERDFDDLKILHDHQKAKHFHCTVGNCNRRLNTAGGLKVHMQQVHKEELHEVPNAKDGRKDIGIEIFGMEGVPQPLVDARTQYVTEYYHKMEAEYRAKTGNPLPGTVKADEQPVKKPKVESKEDLKRRVAEAKARKAKEKADAEARSKFGVAADSDNIESFEGIGPTSTSTPDPALATQSTGLYDVPAVSRPPGMPTGMPPAPIRYDPNNLPPMPAGFPSGFAPPGFSGPPPGFAIPGFNGPPPPFFGGHGVNGSPLGGNGHSPGFFPPAHFAPSSSSPIGPGPFQPPRHSVSAEPAGLPPRPNVQLPGMHQHQPVLPPQVQPQRSQSPVPIDRSAEWSLDAFMGRAQAAPPQVQPQRFNSPVPIDRSAEWSLEALMDQAQAAAKAQSKESTPPISDILAPRPPPFKKESKKESKKSKDKDKEEGASKLLLADNFQSWEEKRALAARYHLKPKPYTIVGEVSDAVTGVVDDSMV